MARNHRTLFGGKAGDPLPQARQRSCTIICFFFMEESDVKRLETLCRGNYSRK
jgi:hypothetical protein